MTSSSPTINQPNGLHAPTDTVATSSIPSSPLAVTDIPSDGLSMRAKVGVGLGVGIGVILVGVLILWIIFDPLARFRHRRNADGIEAASRAQGRARSPVRNKPPTPPSLRGIVLASPTASNLSPGLDDHSSRMSPVSANQAEQRSTEPQDMTELRYHEDAAPAPVVGGIGVGRSGSAQSRQGSSSSFSNRRPSHQYSAQGQAPHVRSGSQHSLYAIGSQGRRPSTARTRPAIGLWGIDPTGIDVTSESTSRHERSNSITVDAQPGMKGEVPTRDIMHQGDQDDPHGKIPTAQHQMGVSIPPSDRDKPLPPPPPPATVNLDPSATARTVRRSSSQRSARIMMSPISLAGQRYDMAVEL